MSSNLGILSWLFVGAVLMKWASVGTPADWSWWFLGLAFLVPIIAILFLQSVARAMKELSESSEGGTK